MSYIRLCGHNNQVGSIMKKKILPHRLSSTDYLVRKISHHITILFDIIPLRIIKNILDI